VLSSTKGFLSPRWQTLDWHEIFLAYRILWWRSYLYKLVLIIIFLLNKIVFLLFWSLIYLCLVLPPLFVILEHILLPDFICLSLPFPQTKPFVLIDKVTIETQPKKKIVISVL